MPTHSHYQKERKNFVCGGAGSVAEELHPVIHQVPTKELGKRPDSVQKAQVSRQ